MSGETGPHRILLYAVGRAGLGHAMRAHRLAQHLIQGRPESVEAVVITGHVGADVLLGEGPRVRVRVPSAIARLMGDKGPAHVPHVSIRDAVKALVDVLEEIDPTVVISTSPSGLHGELRLAMEDTPARYRSILALRDIYHPPRYQDTYEALGARFDQVLLAGPADLSQWAPQQLRELNHPPVTHIGYLAPLDRVASLKRGSGAPQLRCQVGGGRDGAQTVETVVDVFASLSISMRHSVALHVDVGPFFAQEALRRLRSLSVPGLEISTWTSSNRWAVPPLAVISMGGYNSCVEAAWTGVPTLLWPRHDDDDLEQEVRAMYFADHFRNIHVHDGSTRSLRGWIEQQIDQQVRGERPERVESSSPGFFADPESLASLVLNVDAMRPVLSRYNDVQTRRAEELPR